MSDATDKQITEKKSPDTRRNLSRYLALGFGLLLLVGIGLLGFMFMEQSKSIAALFAQQNQFSQQNAASSVEIGSLQNDVQSLNQALNQANSLETDQTLELERLNREIISTRLRINDSGTNNQVWSLTEAESLLRLAQQRLIISHDVRAALALLIASDDILKQINDPAIFSIRNVLASDMAALRSVTEVDVQGIYLQLGALSERIDFLQVVSGVERSLSSIEENGSVDSRALQNDQSGFFESMLESFSQYIIVRRRDQPIQPLLSSEQEFFLKQNIKLQLEQARLSLLQEREEIFRSSITQALNNIEQYLESSGTQKQSVIEALNVLLEMPITVQVPVVSSLTALQQTLPIQASQANEVSTE
jgi:uroporphyrin-III C-methyltransferase